ncbi:MAG TPA: cell wall-binding repeat-containing protein [Acidothermaceae bacterium]
MANVRARTIGIVGLAFTVASGLVVATAGSAAAVFQSGSATFTTSGAVPLSTGASGQPLNAEQLAITNSATQHVWAAGDSITFELWNGTTGNELSDTAASPLQSASFSSVPALVANNGIDPSYYNLTLATGPNSVVNDEFVLTFFKDAPENAFTTTFTFSNLALSLGSKIPAGQTVQIKATASGGAPFPGAAQISYLTVGNLPSVSVSISSLVTGAPNALAVPLGKVSLTDIAGGAVNAGDEIDLTLVDGSFTKAGSLAGTLTTAQLATTATVKSPGDTAKVIASKTSVVGDTLSLTGAQFSMPATAEEIYLTVTDKTTAKFLGSVGVGTTVQQSRIGGSDRYATASQLFESEFSGATAAVVTSGANYPDALSASYLAGQLETGVLTTDPAALPASIQQALLQSPIATVYLVGGTSAVSQHVQDQIAALHVSNNSANALISVVRIAGADRYATNQLVDTKKGPGGSTTAIIATGANFADALAVGPAVYKSGDPLILVAGGSLPPSAAATIDVLGIKNAIIVGGTSAISPTIETALAGLGVQVQYRIAGSDRTQTAADIAAWETNGLPASGPYSALGGVGFSGSQLVNIARGDTFADALAAGPVAGSAQNVIVLTGGPGTLGAGIPQYLAGRAAVVTTIRALGLGSAVSAGTLNAAAESLTEPLAT